MLPPDIRIVPSIELMPRHGGEVARLVPIDDTHHRSDGVAKVRELGNYTWH